MYTPSTRIDGAPIQSGLETMSYLGPRYLRERGGDFTDSRLASKLGAISTSHLLLLPEHISGISLEAADQPNMRPHDIDLTVIPKLEAGRQNSRHEVQFGQLHIAGDSTHPIAELVATKYLNRVAAPRELHASLEVNRRFGDNMSFQPIGFVRQPNTDKIGYLTRYEHGVLTLDNILWNMESGTQLREEALGFAGLWLASLHNHKIIHGDAQAKNIAYDSSQKLRYIDLEGAQVYDADDPMSRIQRLTDVSDVFNTTYMPPTTPAENEAFIEAYLEQQTRNPHFVDGTDIKEVIDQAQNE